MIETIPEVTLISKPTILWDEIWNYLEDIGMSEYDIENYVEDREDRIMSPGDAVSLPEFAGRMCYKSFAPGLNKNVTKVRSDVYDYFENIIKSGHGSILEHVQLTFLLTNVSRVATHEIVRHRVGTAISQESLRYVRLEELPFRIPDRLPPEIVEKGKKLIRKMEKFQIESAEFLGLDDDGVDFHYKKEMTSALRRFAPMGVSTSMVWSANLRTLRHVIPLRTSPAAEEELRMIFKDIGDICVNEFRPIFQDFEFGLDGSWVTQNG